MTYFVQLLFFPGCKCVMLQNALCVTIVVEDATTRTQGEVSEFLCSCWLSSPEEIALVQGEDGTSCETLGDIIWDWPLTPPPPPSSQTGGASRGGEGVFRGDKRARGTPRWLNFVFRVGGGGFEDLARNQKPLLGLLLFPPPSTKTLQLSLFPLIFLCQISAYN